MQDVAAHRARSASPAFPGLKQFWSLTSPGVLSVNLPHVGILFRLPITFLFNTWMVFIPPDWLLFQRLCSFANVATCSGLLLLLLFYFCQVHTHCCLVAEAGDSLSISCSSSQFRCVASGTCISYRFICNNICDCSDCSDEQRCSKPAIVVSFSLVSFV